MNFFKKKIFTPFAAVLIALGVGVGSWGVTTWVAGGFSPAEPAVSAPAGSQAASSGAVASGNSEIESLFADAVEDAMVAQPDEIKPLVVLDKKDDRVTWNQQGDKVLLLSWHKYPESYVEGSEITLEYGPVWTFTDKEIIAWYQENQKGVTDWDMRLRQLIGLMPDSMYTHMTAFWADPKDVVRPAYCQDTTHDDMATTFTEEPSEEYLTWFNGNIVSSYFEGSYPWTRLGYTYDWAVPGKEYGLTEFLIAKDAPVTVEFTKSTADFLKWMEEEGK